MLCPLCRSEMLVLEFEQVEVDYCAGCGGVWLDSGELELVGGRAGVLEDELLRALEQPQGAPPPQGKRRCPVCRKAMLEVRTETEPPITLDRCPREHGLWFDHGELGRLVRAAGAKEQNVLARLFADLGSHERRTD